MRITQVLERDPGFGVYEVFCDAPASPLSEAEGTGGFSLILPQRGRFTRQVNGTRYLVDNSTSYFELPEQEQRVGHPCDGGDICTVIPVAVDLLTPVADPSEIPVGPLMPSSTIAFQHRALLAAARRADLPVAIDHVVGLITEALSSSRPTKLSARPEASHRWRRIVETAREALANDPSVTLPELGATAGCSPHHLSRIFALVVGCSVSQYRMQLRIALALERLSEGDDNLSLVAAQAGFADHAHLTRAARRLLGETPSSLRSAIQRGGKRA
jgi:AraC-like DNA-binding protein